MRAFTLIEAMVVLAIVGVMCALAVPSIVETVKRERTRSEVQKVADAVSDARNRARVRVCEVRLSVDVTSNSLTVAANPTDSDVPCREMRPRTVPIDRSLLTLAAFNVDGATKNPLVFDSSGGLSGALTRARMTLDLGYRMRSLEVQQKQGHGLWTAILLLGVMVLSLQGSICYSEILGTSPKWTNEVTGKLRGMVDSIYVMFN